jgi:hypothetical protein
MIPLPDRRVEWLLPEPGERGQLCVSGRSRGA